MYLPKSVEDYVRHLMINWNAAFSIRYHHSWPHTISDFFYHFIHGLLPYDWTHHP